MEKAVDVLSTATLHRPIENGLDLVSIDFLVDGVSLFTATGADKADLAGCFMSMCADGVHEHTAQMLLGEQPTELRDARFALFICALCGALSCGAITFQLGRSPGLIHWSAFAFEYDDDARAKNFDRYRSLGPFEFDIVAYRQTIEHAVAVISALRNRRIMAPNANG
jgi:hypothetical protein